MRWQSVLLLQAISCSKSSLRQREVSVRVFCESLFPGQPWSHATQGMESGFAQWMDEAHAQEPCSGKVFRSTVNLPGRRQAPRGQIQGAASGGQGGVMQDVHRT